MAAIGAAVWWPQVKNEGVVGPGELALVSPVSPRGGSAALPFPGSLYLYKDLCIFIFYFLFFY